MKIKSQSLPTRCEICHQLDEFDPVLNHCQRCCTINYQVAALPEPVPEPAFETPGVTRLRKVLSGLKISFYLSVFGTFFGLPLVGKMLPPLSFDLDWIGVFQQRLFLVTLLALLSIGFVKIMIFIRADKTSLKAREVEWFVAGCIVAVLFCIMFPGPISARRSANRQVILQALTNIHRAQEAYRSGPGKGQYAPTLAWLTSQIQPEKALTEREAALETIGLAGYQLKSFQVFPATSWSPARYELKVAPQIRTGMFRGGNHQYYLDQSGVIRESGDSKKPANAQSPREVS
ncbi:MAG TPA: hypothetical protein PLU80_13915 [Acidobacteriota bacterium]|nr:hypothetical protein [Acidobacteriota bacterium]